MSAWTPDEAMGESERRKAAQTIQRNYRGYRSRRAMQGMTLSASDRWMEAVREAQFRLSTKPTSRRQRDSLAPPSESPDAMRRRKSSDAQSNWKRIGTIARRAGHDDMSDDEAPENMDEAQLAEHRKRKAEAKREREKTAKMMDLQYFLEMVDQKHRYGSNLRAYHEEWKKSNTHENFFYWLDRGSGMHVELPTISRQKLETEQVRYLSKEERRQYLVQIDEEGRMCWAKNGERVTTSLDYKDSVNGIVPVNDDAPAYRDANGDLHRKSSSSADSTLTSSSSSSGSTLQDAEHYTNEFDQAKGVRKLKHVSPATILDHLLRKSVKKNSWIFVADTSFRLYVSIKQSGAFQHSSFLNGARISAAGLIKIKDGQLRRLSPLSGHYRPPTKNFRAFVHSLRDAGVDMSRVSISRSYAVLVGLEAYVKTRKKIKKGFHHASEQKDKTLHPQEFEKREEQRKDKSRSAEKERQVLQARAQEEEGKRSLSGFRRKLWRRLSSQDGKSKATEQMKGLSIEGQGVEDAIPPQGKR